MKKKLKISKKIKFTVVVNGTACSYSGTYGGGCDASSLCYKSPVPLKGNGLYVSKNSD